MIFLYYSEENFLLFFSLIKAETYHVKIFCVLLTNISFADNMMYKGVNSMQTFDKICILLREQLGLDSDFPITKKTTIQDINADSLDVAEFFMTLEEAFDVEIPEDAEFSVHTMGDVANLIESLILS